MNKYPGYSPKLQGKEEQVALFTVKITVMLPPTFEGGMPLFAEETITAATLEELTANLTKFQNATAINGNTIILVGPKYQWNPETESYIWIEPLKAVARDVWKDVVLWWKGVRFPQQNR